MQNIWTRAVQARCTCRCTACVQRSVAATRNASVATRKAFLLPVPSSTYVYTAIFAVAAAADASAKRRRREQWDAAIEDARKLEEEDEEIVGQQQEGSSERLPRPWIFGFRPTTALRQAVPYTPVPRNYDSRLAVSSQSTPGLNEEVETAYDGDEIFMDWEYRRFDNLIPHGPTPVTPEHTGAPIKAKNLPPQSVNATPEMRERFQDTVWTPKKLRTVEVRIGRLILELLEESKLVGTNYYTIPEDCSDSMRAIAQIPRLRFRFRQTIVSLADYEKRLHKASADLKDFTEDPPWPCPHYNPSSSASSADPASPTSQMNDAMMYLLKTYEERVNGREWSKNANRMSPQTLVLKLCDHLLNADARPDLRTFNILLTGFTRLGKHNLAERVVWAVDRAHIRPNEIMCAATLNHYTRKKDAEGFSRYVAKIRGLYGGTMLARSNIEISDASEGRLYQNPNGKIIQKVQPHPMVFNALMKGVLQFAGLQRAMEIYTNMNEDGWGLDATGLQLFLARSLQEKQWDIGLTIWKETRNLAERSHVLLKQIHICTMLALCHTCGQGETFRDVFEFGVGQGHDAQKLSTMTRDITAQPNRPALSNDETKARKEWSGATGTQAMSNTFDRRRNFLERSIPDYRFDSTYHGLESSSEFATA